MSNISKTLAWVAWAFSLAASPAVMAVLGAVYYRPPDHSNFMREPPWQVHVVEYLFVFHLALSSAAIVCVFRVVSDWPVRRHVCFAVLMMLFVTAYVALLASMDISGKYL